MSRLNRARLFGAAGLACLSVALLFVLVPGVIPAPVYSILEIPAVLLTPTGVATAIAVLILVYGFLSGRSSSPASAGQAPLGSNEPETVTPPPDPAGERFDDLLDRTAATLASGMRFDGETTKVEHQLVQALETATESHDGLDGPNDTTTELEAQIAAGTWTTDRTAGAFLGGPDAPAHTFTARVRKWVWPEREFRRRVARTTDAIEARFEASAQPHETQLSARTETSSDPIPTEPTEDGPNGAGHDGSSSPAHTASRAGRQPDQELRR